MQGLHPIPIEAQVWPVHVADADNTRPPDLEIGLVRNRFDRRLRLRRRWRAVFSGLMRQEGEGNAKDVDVLRLKEFDLLPGHRVGLFFRVVGGAPQAAPNHLFTQQLAGKGAQTHDVGDGLGVPALREHPDGNHVLDALAGLADLAYRVHLQAQQLGLFFFRWQFCVFSFYAVH